MIHNPHRVHRVRVRPSASKDALSECASASPPIGDAHRHTQKTRFQARPVRPRRRKDQRMTSPIHLPECETGSCVMRHETVASDVKASVRNLTHDESREDDCPDRPKENR